MPEGPPPLVAGDVAVNSEPALTPEAIEAVIDEFRAWLLDAAAGLTPAPVSDGEEREAGSIDLHTLLGQLVALRHDVKLETKAVRAQQEQTAAALEHLGQALTVLQEDQAPDNESQQQALEDEQRSLLKTLLDVYDALGLAAREAERVQDAVLAALGDLETRCQATAEWHLRGPAAWFVRRQVRQHAAAQQELRQSLQQAATGIRQWLDSFLTGYTMSRSRIERALAQLQLEPMPTVGLPFDPELMEVVDVVSGSERPAGQVVEEVRPGYLRCGRVFRYAQVRVARDL